MTKRFHSLIGFSSVKGRRIECGFGGAHITGNGGIQLLSEVDRRTGLTESLGLTHLSFGRQATVLSIISARVVSKPSGMGRSGPG